MRRRLGDPHASARRPAGGTSAARSSCVGAEESSGEPSRDRNCTMTCSMPERVACAARACARRASSSVERHVDDGPDVEQDAVPAQPARSRVGGAGRAQASRQASSTCSSCGSARTFPSSSRSTVRSRTSHSDDQPPVLGHVAADARGTGGRRSADGRRVSVKSRSRHSPSRSATIGCRPRSVRSSTGRRSVPGRNVNQLSPAVAAWPSVAPHPHACSPGDRRRERQRSCPDAGGAASGRRWPPARAGRHVEVESTRSPAGRASTSRCRSVCTVSGAVAPSGVVDGVRRWWRATVTSCPSWV